MIVVVVIHLDGASLVRESGEMCSVEFLFWDTLFESNELVFFGIMTGLLSILPVAVTPVVVVVVSIAVVIITLVESGCPKSAQIIANIL